MEDIHPNCPLDCNAVESIEHILFFCPFAKEVWASEPHLIQFQFNSTVTFLDIY